jgi:hypothetical protein
MHTTPRPNARRRTLLVLLLALLAPSAPAAAQGAAPIVGINSHLLTPQAVAQLKALGVRRVRTTMLWPLWTHPTYPISFAENVKRADEAGIKLTIVVHNWPGDAAVFKSGVNRQMMRDFGAFVAARARQFPTVEAWQLWNEQDVWWQAPFGASDGIEMRQRGRLYAEQLRIAYPLIKRANPRALVVTGGTAEDPGSGFLAGMMESRPPFDVVAIHAYGAWPRSRQRIATARRIVGPEAAIWVTEAGENTDDRNHLAAWRGIIEGNASERLAQRIYPYALEASGPEARHGLVIAGQRAPRPTFAWLRDWFARGGAR